MGTRRRMAAVVGSRKNPLARAYAKRQKRPGKSGGGGVGGKNGLQNGDCLYLNLEDYEAGTSDSVWQLRSTIADRLMNGEVGVLPTDSNYAFVCDIENTAGLSRLYRAKGASPTK